MRTRCTWSKIVKNNFAPTPLWSTAMIRFRRRLFTTLAAALLVGCAPTSELLRDDPDPFESYNRAMFTFNDAVDKAVFKPVAQVYQTVLPDPVITSVTHFFSNLNDVVVLANDLLQFKFHQAAMDSSRIVCNTTFGVLGLFDVASHMELPKHREDFGQTLGVWGFSEGYFIVLPFLGPSTTRDTVGLVGDSFTNPVTWATDSETVEWSLRGLDFINRRARLLRVERAIAEAQIDPYSFQRSAYLQHRRSLVNDGSPSKPDFDLDNPDNLPP